MKKYIFLILFSLFAPKNSHAETRQFPVPGQIYVPGKDTGFGQYLTKSLRNSEKVVLTFDDGPDAVTTPILLDTLKKFNIKATFFVLTDKITPETLPIIKRMIAEGHNLGSHHNDHINNNTKPESEYRNGLKKSILMTAGLMDTENSQHKEVYYRFPYGLYGSSSRAYHHLNVMKDVSNELFGDNCINFVFWDIDTVDWLEDMSPAEIAQNVMSNLKGGTAYEFKKNSDGSFSKVIYKINKPIGGGVVLMHDVHARSVASIPLLLKKFADEGVQVVPLQEVEEFAYNGKECRLKI